MSTHSPAPNGAHPTLESVIALGDLSRLTPSDRVAYYSRVCESLGLNPLTRPFEYLTLNGKLTLYARRDCADQLRKINGISIEVVGRDVADGLITVHVRARARDGRTDEDFGVVSVSALKGEAAANAMLKAVTKAKRRVTLSICGLGMLDETEVDDIPAAAKRIAPEPAQLNIADRRSIAPAHDTETGETGPRAIPVAVDAAGAPLWASWAQFYLSMLEQAATLDEFIAWEAANAATLSRLSSVPNSTKFTDRLASAVSKARARFVTLRPEDLAPDKHKPIETITGGMKMLEPADLADPAILLSARR